jgi:hypothetical protein
MDITGTGSPSVLTTRHNQARIGACASQVYSAYVRDNQLIFPDNHNHLLFY